MDKKQLLEEISKLPDDIKFLSAKDDEGNGYRWISGVSVEYIHKDDAESWEVESVLSEEDMAEDYDEEETEEYFKKVAVIW